MEIIYIFDKKVNEIISKGNVYCILIIGAGAKIERKYFHLLNDIDLFVVTEGKACFEREVVDIDGVKFDISYMSLDLLEKGIFEKWTFIITALNNYKYVYHRDNEIDRFLNKIEKIYKSGPEPINEEEINFIRFKLYQDYEDILARLDDKINSLFLMNNLFKNILISYFKLNNLWIPKDKKILKEIEKVDLNLFFICKSFIEEENIEKKLKSLLEMLNYILKPFGGYLKKWNKGKFLLK